MLIDENENLDVYRFWTHFFSESDLGLILDKFSFKEVSYHSNVLPEGDMWNGDNVTFCRAINIK